MRVSALFLEHMLAKAATALDALSWCSFLGQSIARLPKQMLSRAFLCCALSRQHAGLSQRPFTRPEVCSKTSTLLEPMLRTKSLEGQNPSGRHAHEMTMGSTLAAPAAGCCTAGTRPRSQPQRWTCWRLPCRIRRLAQGRDLARGTARLMGVHWGLSMQRPAHALCWAACWRA